MILPLCYFGNSVLREPARTVERFDPELTGLARNMVETMHAECGIGLAGPQIGQPLRIFVMEIPPDMDVDEDGKPANPGMVYPLVAVNPEVVDPSDDEDEMEEGCLSIPDVRGKVIRPVSITLRYQDLEGVQQERRLHELAARCAQHETDHLNGILFIDHLSAVKRLAIKGKLRKIRESKAVCV